MEQARGRDTAGCGGRRTDERSGQWQAGSEIHGTSERSGHGRLWWSEDRREVGTRQAAVVGGPWNRRGVGTRQAVVGRSLAGLNHLMPWKNGIRNRLPGYGGRRTDERSGQRQEQIVGNRRRVED